MSSSKTSWQQPAFILHTRAYRETSLMLTLFTPEFGKLQATIKGIKGASKTTRQKQAWLQPFQALQIQWKATQETDWIYPTSYEPYNHPYLLLGEANICGLYLNELLYRLLQNLEPMPSLFLTYQTSLQELSLTTERAEQAWVLRKFELELLDELGYSLNLLEDAQGNPINPELNYSYFNQQGLIADVQGTWSGKCLIQLANQEFCQDCLIAWRNLLRRVLAPHLGTKPLATRQLFANF